ncbi:MAG: hypothetical protein WBO17_01695, partial [Sphingorhabdus sp.]
MTIDWQPGIGDPSFMGWLTVIAYFGAAFLSFRAAIIANTKSVDHRSPANTEQIFWFAMTVILIFLGINKQLDLQSLFTAVAREIAKSQDWYSDRRVYQILFIKFLGGFTLALGLALLWILRK